MALFLAPTAACFIASSAVHVDLTVSKVDVILFAADKLGKHLRRVETFAGTSQIISFVSLASGNVYRLSNV